MLPVLFALLGAVGLLFGVQLAAGEAARATPSTCESSRVIPEGVTGQGDPVSDARFTLWPLGIECDWVLADGTTVTQESDWGITAVVYGSGAVLLASLGLLGARLVRSRHPER